MVTSTWSTQLQTVQCVTAKLCFPHVQVYIDMKPVENGTLYDDFDMLPPKKIKVCAVGGCWRWKHL